MTIFDEEPKTINGMNKFPNDNIRRIGNWQIITSVI